MRAATQGGRGRAVVSDPMQSPCPFLFPCGGHRPHSKLGAVWRCLFLACFCLASFASLLAFLSLRVFWRWCCCCGCCICRRSSFSSSSSSYYYCCPVAGAALALSGGISTRSSSRRLSGEYNKCDS